MNTEDLYQIVGKGKKSINDSTMQWMKLTTFYNSTIAQTAIKEVIVTHNIKQSKFITHVILKKTNNLHAILSIMPHLQAVVWALAGCLRVKIAHSSIQTQGYIIVPAQFLWYILLYKPF